MTGRLPPVLDHLRDQLREAAARDIAIERQVDVRVADRIRRGRRRRWLLVTLGALVAFGGVAVAERAIDRTGPDIAGDVVPRHLTAAAGEGIVTNSAVADPGGGPPWALRVFTNQAGLDCVALGRLKDGRLGTYDQSRTFRALPVHVSGVCEPVAKTGLLVAVQHNAIAPQRTIVFGLARDRQPVRITVGGVTRTVVPGGLGSFVDVRTGLFKRAGGALVSTTAGGRTVERRLG
jgi:hypothetical protein